MSKRHNHSYLSIFWRGETRNICKTKSKSRVEPCPSSSRSDPISTNRSNSSSLTRSMRRITVKSSVEPSSPDSSSTNRSTASDSNKLVCDKCDGKHETSRCPHFKKNRGSHPDAQKNFYKKLGGTSTLPGAIIKNGRVARQPGDGSCLFHSMSHGLRDGSHAASLRRDICAFIGQNPGFKIADTPLSDWIKWDSGGSVGSYTRRMSMGAWGGGIEMATMSIMKGVNVHVYERSPQGFRRISAFDHPNRPEERKTVRVLYCGGVHYGKR